MIVTANLSDFPEEVLKSFGIQAQHPDDFVLHLLDLNATEVCEAAKMQRESLKKPPLSKADFLNSLERQGLKKTVDALRAFIDLI